jgi:signal transduction histidine kinase
VEKTYPPDSYDRLAASIERVLRSDLEPPESSSHLVGSIDRIMFDEARAGELRLAYLRAVVIAPYLIITVWALLRRAPDVSPSPLIPAAVLGGAWLAGAAALAIALRRGWYGRWLPHAAPLMDAGMILAGFVLWWRLHEPVWHLAPAEVLGYVTALCAFLSLSGALRLSRWSARAGTVLGVTVFLAAAVTSGVDSLLAGAIGVTLLATGLLSASVTTLVRRVVTDEVARATLTRMYDEAAQTIDAREQVLKIVSHDLRNPLHTISMCAALLLELPMPPDQLGEHLSRIKRAVDRMNRLIQDLLDAAKLETGRVGIDARSIEVAPIINEAHEMLAPLAAEKSIRLDAGVGASLPTITADAGRVLQVLSNLVGNAIKFTPAGGRIAIRADAAPGGVKFSVSDTGQGIPPEQLAKIFGRFWQANPADRRGIGLGLTIAKGIVEAHGGRIWVESRIDEGTTFHFTLSTEMPPTASGARERRKEGETSQPA